MLYRLAFGQPRQEDMLAALQRHGIAGRPELMAGFRLPLVYGLSSRRHGRHPKQTEPV